MQDQSSNSKVESKSEERKRLVAEHNSQVSGGSNKVLSYTEKQEMNALSKEVFGASSRWVKLVEQGYNELVTEEIEEEVPADENGENGGIEVVTKPVLTANGARQFVKKRHTIQSVRELMMKLKLQRDIYLARIKQMQADAEMAKKIQSEVSGSAGL